MQVKGQGANLPDPVLALLTGTVTVQLINSHSDVCFGAEYTSTDVIKHEVDQFKAWFK